MVAALSVKPQSLEGRPREGSERAVPVEVIPHERAPGASLSYNVIPHERAERVSVGIYSRCARSMPRRE